MIDIVGMIKSNILIPFSEWDRVELHKYHEGRPVRIRISGVGSEKLRSYRHLCCYFGSCEYIASLAENENTNTKFKVDHLTRLKMGFVKGTIFGPDGSLQWIPDDLNFANCNHPKSVAFINSALDWHAENIGMKSTDEYIRLLNEQKSITAR